MSEQRHPDPAVNQALIQLADALCTWERGTGRQSVLILREQGGFEFRAQSGKPSINKDIPDALLFGSLF